MKDFGSRLVSTLISVSLLLALFFFAFHSWVPYLVAIAVAVLAIIAIWEYEQLAKAKGGKTLFYVLGPLAAAIVLSFFFQVELLVLFLSAWLLFALHFRKKEGALVDLAVSLFGLFYIAIPMGMMLTILYLPGGEDGRLWLAWLLAVTKITDMGAYFVGSLWGKRKLAPSISPGKTVEGAIFGWFCAVGMSVAFYGVNQIWDFGDFHLNFRSSLWLGALLGVASQFGDLAESLLKRDAEKKDSNQLPGIGGILDLVDSLLFNTPILYIYLLHTT